MKSFSFVSAVAALAFTLLLSCAGPVQAAAKKAPPAPPPDMRKMIKSVDVAKNQVIIIYMHSKLTHTYGIDGVTVVKVNNVTGKIDDIKPGMEVTDYLERDDDNLDSISVDGNGTEPPVAKPKPAGKPKPKPALKPPAPTQ